MLGAQFTPPVLARSDLARSSPSRIANQGINEGRCSFLKLLADKLAYPPDGRKKSMDTHTRGVMFGLLVIILASAAILAGSYVW